MVLDAKEAIPALKKVLTDPDPALRLGAAYALARIEDIALVLRQHPLLRPLHQPDDGSGRFNGVRVATIILPVFERLAPDCPELIPATLRLFLHYRWAARPESPDRVDRKVPALTAKAIVPDLLKLLGDDRRGTAVLR